MRISLKHIVILNLTQIIFICLIIGLYLFSSEIRIPGNINYLNESLNKREKYSFKKVSIPRNLIWEQLNENVFFKRTSAFFIIERLLLRSYLVRDLQTDCDYNARIEIELDNGQFHHIYLMLLYILTYIHFHQIYKMLYQFV